MCEYGHTHVCVCKNYIRNLQNFPSGLIMVKGHCCGKGSIPELRNSACHGVGKEGERYLLDFVVNLKQL